MNSFKIKYDLSVQIESYDHEGAIIECDKQGVTDVIESQPMQALKRITVITPDFSEPILNQEIKMSSKIKKMGVVGAGKCSYVAKLEKDVLYPNEFVNLKIDMDNTQCSKKI